MNCYSDLQDKMYKINKLLLKYLPKEEGPQINIQKAMNYSIIAGGKRLRPVFLIETFKLFTKKEEMISEYQLNEIVERFAVAIEMIHTYSLVHDDLPAMDNDLLRRGKETTHAKFGHAMGILAGDALLNYAFEIISSAYECAYLANENECKFTNKNDDSTKLELFTRINKASSILAKKAGIFGMIAGQVIDMETKKEDITNEILLKMYSLKTSALIEAAFTIGATLAGANDEELTKLTKIANNIGLAFQIKDDILDETSTKEELGKDIHSDKKNNKVTFLTLNGLEESKKQVDLLTKEAIKLFDSFDKKNDFLRELIIQLIDRNY